MHDVHHAISALGQSMGMKSLGFNANGDIALVFDSKINVFIMRVSDHEVEYVTRLPRFDDATPASGLRKLLEANFAGTATGAGRIAVDPSDGSVLFTERVDVRPLEAADFSKSLMSFVDRSGYWLSDEAAASITEPDVIEPVNESADDTSHLRAADDEPEEETERSIFQRA